MTIQDDTRQSANQIDKTVIVTGGASGIGGAITRVLLHGDGSVAATAETAVSATVENFGGLHA